MSYDVQNIEPVAPANVVRRYGVKEESFSHSSTKDSAYGSMEVKVNVPSSLSYKYENRQASSIDGSITNSPSRSLSAVSINQYKLPLTTHAQRIQRSEEVYSKELESLKGSTSTLHSQGNSSRSNSLQITRNGSLDSPFLTSNEVPAIAEKNFILQPNNPVITQNGFSPGRKLTTHGQTKNPSYISMKSTIYDNVGNRNDLNSTVSDINPINNHSPYTSMMNIVQGQIKISPHENETNKNVVNVSVKPVHRKKRL